MLYPHLIPTKTNTNTNTKTKYEEKEYEKEKTESVIIIIFCIQISEKEDKEIKTYRWSQKNFPKILGNEFSGTENNEDPAKGIPEII